MNWDAIGAIGEVAGAIAVVATLLYFAKQIRTMQKNSYHDLLRAITVDEIELEKMRLQYAELLVRANSGLELSDTEQYEISRIYDAHETYAFHGYMRERGMWNDRHIRCLGFAILLNENPALLSQYRFRTFPGQEVLEFKEIVDNFLKEQPSDA